MFHHTEGRDDNKHHQGVGLLLSRHASDALLGYECINERFLTAKFQTSVKDLNVICCYAPTEDADEDEKDRFYEQLQDILNSVKKGDITLVLGDFNAKVGTDSDLWGGVIGPFGIGSCNGNGQRLLQVKPTNQSVEELPSKESPVAEEASSVASHDVSNTEEVTSVERKTSFSANGKGDTGSKVQVVFPAMEDTPGITTSPPSDATTSTANIALSADPLTFHAQSHVEIYPSSTGQLEGDTQSGERPIPLPELKAMLQQQLEYYFSRENLATDAYLLSQMDSDQYVPIGTIAKFNQIRRLTEDINLIVEVLRESAFVQVDEAGEKVRPNQRSFVLILREIPETTPMKELEDLFSSENCPKFSRCEFAHNNSWYVLFESDEDTQKAYRYLREEAKTFKGKPIMARIKASSMTSAPFTHSYKNGICQPSEAEPYNAQQQMNQQQQQQQQQQQAQVQYTYTNVAGDGYNNQQMCPPFYPPTMLQAWAPTTPACVDLGTVFSMNGLSPQAAFRPLNNTNRHNYSSRERQVKSYNPQNYNFTRTEQSSRFFSRNQSTSYLQRQQQQSFHNLMNTGFDYMPYASGSRSLHTFGMDMHNFFTAPNIYFRRLQGHSSLYPTHTSQARHNPMLLARNQVGIGAINSQDQNYLAVGGSVLPFTKDSVLSVTAAGVGKQNTDSQTKEPWGQSQRQRSKRWWKDSGGASTSSKSFEAENSNGLFNKSLSGGDGKPESPKFDLETTSFPPLPGCLDTDILEVEVFESRLSDIVKGTVKPTTRDSKTQTESALSPYTVMKDSSTLTIEETVVPRDIPLGAFSPPASPIVIERVVSEVEEEIVLDSKPIDDWGEGEPLVDEPSDESLCSTSISSTCPTTTTSVTTSITTFTSVISPISTSISSIITMTTTTTSVTTTPTPCALVTSESEASVNVPIEIDVKQTPKMPKNKQLDIMLPKIKPSELPSPKNKSPESAMLKNKLEIVKDKVPLPPMSKHKASSFPVNKTLESSSAKEKTNEFLSLNSKALDITISKTSDLFSIKDKPIQVQLTKAKVTDSSSPKTKGPDAELPESLLSVNGHADSESAQSSEDEKPFRKLTYSEVAIRAKEKVEKLAQELKEKERQEALVRHLRQQELVAQNKQASSRGPFRDFPRGRVTDQQRPGYREWRERRKTTRAASLPSTGQ